MISARCMRGEAGAGYTRQDPPEWQALIWATNERRPLTFDLPELQVHSGGRLFEEYEHTRVIFVEGDRTVRVCVKDGAPLDVVEAFTAAAESLGIRFTTTILFDEQPS